jgi:hypothetical protein
MTDLYWAISPHKSGVYVFVTANARNLWVLQNEGVAVLESQVDPEIVSAERAKRAN